MLVVLHFNNTGLNGSVAARFSNFVFCLSLCEKAAHIGVCFSCPNPVVIQQTQCKFIHSNTSAKVLQQFHFCLNIDEFNDCTHTIL